MSFTLLEESIKGTNSDGRMLQERLDEYNKEFYDTINFFPEAYGRHKVNKDDPSYGRITASLDKNKSDMYELYESVNKKVREKHKHIEKEDVDIDKLRLKRDIMSDELELLVSQDIASGQRKTDKVEYYRRQVVEMFYLLAGIGIMSGSIYHLIK